MDLALLLLAEVALPETRFPARYEPWPSLVRAGAALCLCVYIQAVLLPPDMLTARTASRWAMVWKHPLTAAATVCSALSWTHPCKAHCRSGPGSPQLHPAKGTWPRGHRSAVGSSALQTPPAATSLPRRSGHKIRLRKPPTCTKLPPAKPACGRQRHPGSPAGPLQRLLLAQPMPRVKARCDFGRAPSSTSAEQRASPIQAHVHTPDVQRSFLPP